MGRGSYRVAALGDVMLSRSVGERFARRPEDFACSEIASLLRSYDLVFANLETTVSTRGRRHPLQDPNVAFRSHPRTLAVLRNLGVQVVSLANNHMLDYGDEALLDTRRHLDDWGIRHAGAGADLDQANAPLLLDVGGHELALLSHVFVYSASTRRAGRKTPGVSDHRIAPLLRRIRALRAAGRQVLVSVHWGLEYAFEPVPYQAAQARAMVRAGASLVLGHGPHYPQHVESCGSGHIVHSLGNFIFDEPHVSSNRSFIYGATLDAHGRVVSHDVHPVRIRDGVPERMREPEASELLAKLAHGARVAAAQTRRERQRLHALYLRDVVWRVGSMRSLKFATLPPPAFYGDIGLLNLLRKLRPTNWMGPRDPR